MKNICTLRSLGIGVMFVVLFLFILGITTDYGQSEPTEFFLEKVQGAISQEDMINDFLIRPLIIGSLFAIMGVGQFLLGRKLGEKNNFWAFLPLGQEIHLSSMAKVDTKYGILLAVSTTTSSIGIIIHSGRTLFVRSEELSEDTYFLLGTILLFTSIATYSHIIRQLIHVRLGYSKLITIIGVICQPIWILGTFFYYIAIALSTKKRKTMTSQL